MAECLIGKKYNKLTIVQELPNGKCKCLCDCGGEKIAAKYHIKNNLTTSCGCAKRKNDLTGKVFTHLTVVSFKNGTGYECLCICGKTVYSKAQQLNRGDKKSCGCMANVRPTLVGQVFNELTVIAEEKTIKVGRRVNRLWKCKCSCGKEIVLNTNKLKLQISCGHKRVTSVHDNLTTKYRHLYKKWFAYKKDNLLDDNFSIFKNFVDHIINILGDRKNKYGYLSLKDDTKLASSGNIYWKYKKFTQEFCGVEHKWCTECERFVQNTSKFWPSKKHSSCKKCIKAYVLKKKYNLEYSDYLNLLRKANNQCQICKAKNRLCVDHCHNTGKVRGILCSNCNAGLGHLGHDINNLKKTIEYLQRSSSSNQYSRTSTVEIDKICPISNSDNLVIDHCHSTNLIRGNIDFNINLGIGLFKDNISNLKQAIIYLEQN